MVFEANPYNSNVNPFDGTSQGRATISQGDKLPTGTYFYILNYVDIDGSSKSMSGYLYLN